MEDPLAWDGQSMLGISESTLARELHQKGLLHAAEPHYRAALGLEPEDFSIRRDFAVLLMQTRQEAEAIALIDQPSVIDQANADMLSILTLCLRSERKFERAAIFSERITTLDPENALGWLLHGSLQVRLGSIRGAEASLRRCITIEPSLTEAWHFLGESLQAQGRWDEAIAAYEISSRQQPNEVFNIAICHELAGRIQLAMSGYEAMHRMMPERTDVLARLAQSQAMQCLHQEEAITTINLEKLLGNENLSEDDIPEPFTLCFLSIDEEIKARTLKRHSERIIQQIEPSTKNCVSQHIPSRGHISIGYVSADFGPHAIGELVRSHFSSHDRSQFKVHGYSLQSHTGINRNEIQHGFDTFLDCDSLTDREVADAIEADRIDVLIDMAGFTHGARPQILAFRPAPLQVGWLGFIHGQQAPWLDAIFMDEHVMPVGMPWPYQDKVIRLSGTLFPGSHTQYPGKSDRARFELPDGAPVLASFNNTYKLNPELIAAWSRIMRLAPSAHLMVYLPHAAREGFIQQWTALDGPTHRLHLVGKVSIEEQSDRAASCDLFLDSFRYQGGATAMNAIANHLPVLTVSGHIPTERLGLSINRFLGMEELICEDVETYVTRAAFLANRPDEMQRLRSQLQQQVALHNLFNARRAASSIEQAIHSMIERPTKTT